MKLHIFEGTINSKKIGTYEVDIMPRINECIVVGADKESQTPYIVTSVMHYLDQGLVTLLVRRAQ